MKTHEIKILQEYFEAVKSGKKTFEYRFNDRDYKLGDLLLLREYNLEAKQHTGRQLLFEVTYIIYGGIMGIAENYCIMSIKPVTEERDA